MILVINNYLINGFLREFRNQQYVHHKFEDRRNSIIAANRWTPRRGVRIETQTMFSLKLNKDIQDRRDLVIAFGAGR